MMTKHEERKQFILAYLIKYKQTSVVDERFHSEYWKRFGGIRGYSTPARPVQSAMNILHVLWKEKVCSREIRIKETKRTHSNWNPKRRYYIYTKRKDDEK